MIALIIALAVAAVICGAWAASTTLSTRSGSRREHDHRADEPGQRTDDHGQQQERNDRERGRVEEQLRRA